MKAIVAALAVLLLFSGVAALPSDEVHDDYVVDVPAEKKDNAATEKDVPEPEKEDSTHWYITKSNYILPYDEADGNCFYYVETSYVRNTDYQIAFHTYEVTDLRCWSDN